MPSDPVKLQVRDNMIEALRLISKGAGFHTDAGARVYKLASPMPEVTRFPWLVLYTGKEKRQDPMAGSTRRSVQEYVVEGYVKSKTPDDDLVKLEADVKKALLADMGRGGLAVRTIFDEAVMDYQDMAQSGLAAFRALYLVEANWNPTAP